MQEREAINEILVNINELPLDDDDIIEDVQIAVVAKTFLDISRRKILSHGWYANTINVTIMPNTGGYCVVPNNFLFVDGSSTSDTIVVRDYKLFDTSTNSFIFESGVECTVFEDMFFDDIPHTLANYIVKEASLATYSNAIGDVSGINIRSTFVKEARAMCVREDADMIDGNVLESTYATTLIDRTSI
jgi:hypothetical protein